MPKTWTPEESRRQMQIVLDVRPPGNPTALDWDRVVRLYNAQPSDKCDRIQATNHYNSCHYKWLAWTDMHQMSGITFDEDGLPVREELKQERFKLFIQRHKAGGSGKFVTKYKLNDLDIWNPIFGGRCATREKSYSPALAKSEFKIKEEKCKEKESVIVDGNEGSGDSDKPYEIIGKNDGIEKQAESSSPPRTTGFKKRKLSTSSVVRGQQNFEFAQAFEILNTAETE